MKIDYNKYADGLVPTVIQDSSTRKVLMVGFMNNEALEKTKKSGLATFFSRTHKKLWTKGETSGNYLHIDKILVDCDDDTILIQATPAGPTCHTGTDTCFDEINEGDNFLHSLERIVTDRKVNPIEESHTSKLFKQGANQIVKKLGEETVELIIEALNDNDELFKEEAADLLYYFVVLASEKGIRLDEILTVLRNRNR